MTAGPRPSTLLIVAGQSNALGFGVTPADLPAGAGPDPRVRIWDGARFVTLEPGVNTGTPRFPDAWGPEVEFARRWRHDHPDGALHVVKVVKGQASLAADPAGPDWAPGSGKLFAETEGAVRAARQVLTPPVETILLWAQGEADAAHPARARAYAANLADFRRRAVSAWADGEAAFVLARLNGALWKDSPVRAAQDLHDAYDTDGFPMQPDGLHLSGAGQIMSGAAAYEVWRRRVERNT